MEGLECGAARRWSMPNAAPGADHGILPGPQRLGSCLVVGSGVAGLQVARQLLKLKCQVTVIEEQCDIGGVWRQNYVGYTLQVPWRMYQFPDFLWPQELQPSEEYVSGEQVQPYIRAYAAHFDLLHHIRLNCKLQRLAWSPDNRQWEATYWDAGTQEVTQVTVDYVVMCSGIYSMPYIPKMEGSELFSGSALHAKDFTDISLVRGRRVLIVGSGKTALDCLGGVSAGGQAASIAMLFRKSHWPVPRSKLGLLYNRAIVGMLAPYYTAGPVAQATAAAASPFKWLFWRGLEATASCTFKLTRQFKPHVELPRDMFYGGMVLDDNLDEQVDFDNVTSIRGEIRRFTETGAVLQDGRTLDVDVVLYCTGYDQSYDYLDPKMRSRLDIQKDGLYLYRHCLHPAIPHLAFVGSEVSTFNNILTYGLQAAWLAQVLSGQVWLPPPADMAADIRAQQRWRRRVMPPHRRRATILQLYMIDYHDQLLRDMGLSTRRKCPNLFAECFASYTAADYRSLLCGADAAPGAGGQSCVAPSLTATQQRQQRGEQANAHAGGRAGALGALRGGAASSSSTRDGGKAGQPAARTVELVSRATAKPRQWPGRSRLG